MVELVNRIDISGRVEKCGKSVATDDEHPYEIELIRFRLDHLTITHCARLDLENWMFDVGIIVKLDMWRSILGLLLLLLQLRLMK